MVIFYSKLLVYQRVDGFMVINIVINVVIPGKI